MATSKKATAVEQTVDTTVEMTFVEAPVEETTVEVKNTDDLFTATVTEQVSQQGYPSRDFRSK